MKRSCTVCALLCCVIAASQAVVVGAQEQAATDAVARYHLTSGDTIDVKLPYNPEYNETLIVRPDGAIAMQLIGEVAVAGLTPSEAETTIRSRYLRHLRNPDTTVIVRDFAGQRVYVGGEVGTPGVLPLRGRLTSVEAIAHTGGVKTSAKLNSVVLLRYLGDERTEVRKLNLSRVMTGQDPDVVLQPYDVIFVPRSAIAKVGLFVNQYINALVPMSLVFPYNLHAQITVRDK